MTLILWTLTVGIVSFLCGCEVGARRSIEPAQRLGQLRRGTLRDVLAHGDIVRSGDRFHDGEVTR
jgi:hypothetical protein